MTPSPDKASSNKTQELALTKRAEDFSEWYIQVVRRAGLADYTQIKGCMVIKPHGYAIWENIRDGLDRRFKETGHQNAYFPLFVPESLLTKEADHVEGFAPEVAWVTHGGNKELEERLAIRPTSEAIICSIYADWVQSYRDLPLLINQWANVVRWEKRTRLFLRTSEFLWQEGHTVHRTEEEAVAETMQMLDVYKDFLENEMAVPVHQGKKTESEKFAGAVDTYCIEALMQDGWALQAGTSHFLGQNFSKGFGIKFLDEDNVEKYAWQTSWGVSTRLVGALIMAHSDDSGLVLPPRLAPQQVVFVPVYKGDLKPAIDEKIHKLAAALKAAGIRCTMDLSEQQSPGWKFNQYELKGVPVRIEIGPKDLEKGSVCVARRDMRDKKFINDDQVVDFVRELLDTIQKSLFERAKQFRDDSTSRPTTYDAFQETLETKRGFLSCPWDGTEETEALIKEETKATIRCIPFGDDGKPEPGEVDIRSGQPAKHRVLYARSY